MERTFNYDNNYYDEGIGGFHKASILHIQAAFSKIKKTYPTNAILDFGCGNGFHGAFLKSQAEQLSGVDYSDAIQLSSSKHHYDSLHKFDLGKDIVLPLNHFDMVFSIEVIEHVQDYRKFLRNAYEVLKPGGVMFLTTTTYFWSIFILLAVYRRKTSVKTLYEYLRGLMGSEKYKTKFVLHFWDFFTGHYHGFSKGQIKNGFVETGFKVRDIRYLYIQDVVPVYYFKQPYNGRFKWLVRMFLPIIIALGNTINFICKRFHLYSPNVLVVAEK
ncbi:MAG: methyltransferase domain-containing protein [Chitinophagaceae bacterium]|nr:methyltransferase domain-containing protein [Chitinophagaceae bacterium]